MIDIFRLYDDLVDDCDQNKFSLKNVQIQLNLFLEKLTDDENQGLFDK